MKPRTFHLAFVVSGLVAFAGNASAQGTAFTYQGRLNNATGPATGSYDLRFTVYDAVTNGNVASTTLSLDAIGVTNGLFSATLDFGAGVFNGSARWLDIAVRTNGAATYSVLNPRQPFTAAPYAVTAGTLSGVVPGASLSGYYGNSVNFYNAGNSFNGSFSGNGSALQNLSVNALRTGEVLDIGTARFDQVPISTMFGSTISRPEQMAVADFNGDGWPDIAELYSTGGGTALFVYTNNTRLGFSEFWSAVTNLSVNGQTLAAGDFNGDGYADLFRVNPAPAGQSSTSVALFRGGPATMTYAGAITTGSQPYGLLVDDLNGDGKRDLVVANGGARTFQVFLNTGAAVPALATVYSIPLGRPEIQIASGDLNGDGRKDLVFGFPAAVTYDQARLCIFTNSSGVAYGSATNYSPSSLGEFYMDITAVRIADVDGDGVNEIVFSSYDPSGTAGRILKRTSASPLLYTPWQRLAGSVSVSMIVQDFNFDGRPEIVAGDQFLGNSGNGTYGLDLRLPGIVYGPDEVLVAGDFDRDGRLDLYVSGRGIGGSRKILRNTDGVSVRGGFSVQAPGGAPRLVVEPDSTRFTTPSGATIMSLADTNGLPLVTFDTLATLDFGTRAHQMLNLMGAVIGIGTQPHTLYSRSDSRFLWYEGGTPSEFPEDPGFGGLAVMRLDRYALKIAGGLGVGTFNPQANLHLYSTDNPTTLRIQSSGQPGTARLEFVSDPQGSANEWRPGFIQSTDNGGFTGGLAFLVNGTGAASKFGALEAMRVVNGSVGIGTPSPAERLHVIGNILASGTITGSSDRNVKTNFQAVSSREVLDRVASLPITEWSYKADSEELRHIGPMAQDFHAAFHVGMDDRHISMVDADGVALAAIQGLNQKVNSEVATLRAENAELKRELDELKKMIRGLATPSGEERGARPKP